MNIITLPEELTPFIIEKLSNKALRMSNEVIWLYYIVSIMDLIKKRQNHLNKLLSFQMMNYTKV